jgi:hypothetical protein
MLSPLMQQSAATSPDQRPPVMRRERQFSAWNLTKLKLTVLWVEPPGVARPRGRTAVEERL